MRIPSLRAFAILATIALAITIGCGGGGGGSKSVPSTPAQQNNGPKVGVTFTVTIGSGAQTQSAGRRPQTIPTNTQSIVVSYTGNNPNATPEPGSAPPTGATVAATVNVTATNTNPPPAGQCYASNSTYTCTISLSLPVGTLDVYIAAYSGTNGSGAILANNVVIAQVNANGTITQPGTSTPISVQLLTGAAVGTMTFGAVTGISPTGVYAAAPGPTSYPNSSGSYTYSGQGTVTVADPNGSPIPAGTKIQTLTVSDTDATGATCLVYIPNGASSATPCPFASAASTVSLTTSGDSYAVLYNGKFVANGTITIDGVIPGASATPAPASVSILPSTVAIGSGSFASGPSGDITYDPTGKKIYAGMNDTAKPLAAVPYSTTTGYGALSIISVTSVNGSPAGNLSGSRAVGQITIGPDNNIWFIEHTGKGSGNPTYVAAYVVNASAINPTNGSTISPGAGVFVEYALPVSQVGLPSPGDHRPPTGSIASFGGYIWAITRTGEMWRIDPKTGNVNPNLGNGYAPGGSPNAATGLTNSSGSTLISGTNERRMTNSPLATIGGKLYVGVTKDGSLAALTVDTSSSPSAGVCSPSGPPPCIAYYTKSASGTLPGNNTYGGATDGTSYYILNGNNGKIVKITPPSTVVTASAAFPTYTGGVGISSDGWIWTLTPGGVNAVQSMTAANPVVLGTTTASCGSTQDGYHRGGSPFVVGPDSTLFFSPADDRAGSGTYTPICAVVY